MAPDLTTTDGDTVVEDLTPAEIDRLRRAGVSGPWDDQEPGSGSGSGEPGDQEPDEPQDTEPGGSGDAEPQDEEPDQEPQDTEPGGSGDAEPQDEEPDQEPQDTEPGGSGEGDPDDLDPDDSDTEYTGDSDGTPDEAGSDLDPDDDTTPQGGGDDQGPDLDPDDLDDLDDPDQWDDADDGDTQDADADPDGDQDPDAEGSPSGNAPSGDRENDPTDPEDLADQIDEMADRSKDREVEAQGFDPDFDTDDWSDKLDRARDHGGIREAKRDRDERIDDPYLIPVADSESVQGAMKANGLDRSIREEFEKIKRAPRPRNARSGSDIDQKRATRLFGGDATANKVYLRQNGRKERARRAVGVALDVSGSMGKPATQAMYDGPRRIEMAKVALAGLARACEVIGDDFTATAFQGGEEIGNRRREGRTFRVCEADTPLITGPDEPFQWAHLDSVSADDGTPMAKGIEVAARRLDEADQPDKTLVVIADGEPNDPRHYEGDYHTSHSRKNVKATVEQVRDAGIGVVGVGIGDVLPRHMETMFGEEGYVMADGADLPSKLREVYEKELDTVHGARNR